jgi:putative addiction module component (TIGR02574 family)
MNIKEEVLKLSDSEKLELIGLLWNDIDEHQKVKLSSAKKKFLDTRIKAIEGGEGSFVTLEEIKNRYYSAAK